MEVINKKQRNVFDLMNDLNHDSYEYLAQLEYSLVAANLPPDLSHPSTTNITLNVIV